MSGGVMPYAHTHTLAFIKHTYIFKSDKQLTFPLALVLTFGQDILDGDRDASDCEDLADETVSLLG